MDLIIISLRTAQSYNQIFKLNMKRHNDKPIQDVLRSFVNQKHLKKGITETQVKKIWMEKLGKLIAHHTERIWYNNHIIYIQLNSAPLKNELFMGKANLINSFNKELGEDLIKDIKLI